VTELVYDEFLACLEKGAYDMFYGEMMVPADRDISPFFKPYKRGLPDVDKGLNYFYLFDNRYGELYDAYKKTQESERKLAFRDAAQYVMDTGAIVPICFEKRQVLTHRGTCAGVDVVWTDVFRNYPEWTLDP
ncbi:MAG: hypothetical protein MJ067_01380, partial [Oscillospiraceae bacterium]|nr:hypothetical protein [Oscillospiraceae bacterium]